MYNPLSCSHKQRLLLHTGLQTQDDPWKEMLSMSNQKHTEKKPLYNEHSYNLIRDIFESSLCIQPTSFSLDDYVPARLSIIVIIFSI